MPGILHHFYFSNHVFEVLKTKYDAWAIVLDENTLKLKRNMHEFSRRTFLIGTLIPDYVHDKRDSHFKVPSKIEAGSFVVPELFWAKKQAEGIADWSLKMGIHAHLYLDKHFIEDWLIPSFDWDLEHDRITSRFNGRTCTIKEFYAREPFPPDGGLYYSYGEINALLKDTPDFPALLEFVKTLPEDLPETGVKAFDQRSGESWRQELDRRLDGIPITTDSLFSVPGAIEFLDHWADNLARDLIYAE